MNSTAAQAIEEVSEGSFVFARKAALSRAQCEALITGFESATGEHYAGRVGQQATADPSIKRSTDLVLSGNAHWQKEDRLLFESLGAAMRDFAQTFPFFGGRFRDMGYALQRTNPGGVLSLAYRQWQPCLQYASTRCYLVLE